MVYFSIDEYCVGSLKPHTRSIYLWTEWRMKGLFLKETLVLYMCPLGSETLKIAFAVRD